jgi:hypothetical protein
MVQTPVQQAAQQPPAGDIWSDIQTFSRTPQGQQALLAFANSAMQASMNPQTGGGAGLIGAVGSGMQGYKAADEMETRKARQKKTEAHEDIMMPLEEQKLAAEIENYKKPEAGAYKVGQTREMETNLKDGRKVKYKEQFQGGNVLDPKAWKTISAQVDNPAPREAKDLTMADIKVLATGLVKHPKITQEMAQKAIDQDPETKLNNAWQHAINDKRGWAMTAGDPTKQTILMQTWYNRLYGVQQTPTPSPQGAIPAGPIKKVYNPTTGKME